MGRFILFVLGLAVIAVFCMAVLALIKQYKNRNKR